MRAGLLSNTRMTYDLVGIPAEEFKDSERTTEQIFGEAARRCYRIPPAETALFLGERYRQDELGCSHVAIFHEPVLDPDGDPDSWTVRRTRWRKLALRTCPRLLRRQLDDMPQQRHTNTGILKLRSWITAQSVARKKRIHLLDGVGFISLLVIFTRHIVWIYRKTGSVGRQIK